MSTMEQQLRRNVEQRYVTISNVDTANNTISAIDQYHQLIYISLNALDSVVRIPEPGEHWLVRRQNTSWYLLGRVEDGTEQNHISSLTAGDTRVEASNTLYLTGENVVINARDFDQIISQLQAQINDLQARINAL